MLKNPRFELGPETAAIRPAFPPHMSRFAGGSRAHNRHAPVRLGYGRSCLWLYYRHHDPRLLSSCGQESACRQRLRCAS